MMKTCINCQKPFEQTGSGKPSFCPACQDVGEGKKRCTRCKSVKTLSEFSKRCHGKLHTHCKACDAVYFQGNGHVHAKRRRQEHPERDFAYSMKVKGVELTWEQYQEMMTKQSGVCAICHKPETATRKGQPLPLSVDHDHATSKVRSLLCARCNLFIGQANDDPTLLRNAAYYLEQHKCS